MLKKSKAEANTYYALWNASRAEVWKLKSKQYTADANNELARIEPRVEEIVADAREEVEHEEVPDPRRGTGAVLGTQEFANQDAARAWLTGMADTITFTTTTRT